MQPLRLFAYLDDISLGIADLENLGSPTLADRPCNRATVSEASVSFLQFAREDDRMFD